MRSTSVLLLLCALVLIGTVASAQITLLNSATGGPKSATTTGKAHTIDATNVKVGQASCALAAGLANAAYLPTSVALDPTTNGGCSTANKGFTIQFWYRPAAAATFAYMFGDSTWVGTNGAFRCFQNGIAGTANLALRGPLTQLLTTGAPLTASVGPKGWVHLALVVDGTANSITWYVNGAQNARGVAGITGKGVNLTCMGYNGSSSATAAGNYDDYRIYNWARTAADIAADYQQKASGPGPSKCSNVPDHGYYECEMPVTPHIAQIGLWHEPHGTFTRLFSAGESIEWRVSTPAAGPYLGTAIMNINLAGKGNPRQDAYLPAPPMVGGPYNTSVAPGLEVGHCLSSPPLWSLVWPDGLGVGPIVAGFCGGGVIPIAYSYGSGPGKTMRFTLPNIPFMNGDRIDIQWVTVDSTYPTGIGNSTRTTFEYVTPRPGPHVHVEARGIQVIQVTGFFEIWNTGTIPIKQVCIDFSTLTTSTTWVPTGALNSGGTLATGTSFRHLTDAVCDLTPANNPRYTLTLGSKKLCFDFVCPPAAPADGFQGPTNHFIFDCDTLPEMAGNGYIGATVTVTFCDKTVLAGKLVKDPNDPLAAIIDL